MFSWFKSKSASSSNSDKDLPYRPSVHLTNNTATNNRYPSNGYSTGQTSGGGDGFDEVGLSTTGQYSGSTFNTTSTTAPTPYTTSYPPHSQLDSTSITIGSATSTGYPAMRTTFERLNYLLLPRAPTLRDSLSPGMNPLTSPSYLTLVSALAARQFTLPPAVIDSYKIHDGQDPFSSSTNSIIPSGGMEGDGSGLVYGLWWMSIEEVATEWNIWRSFEERGGRSGMKDAFTLGDQRAVTSHQKQRRDSSERRFNNRLSSLMSTTTKGKGKETDRNLEAIDELAREEEAIQSASNFTDYDDEEDQRYSFEQEGMSSCPPGWVKNKYSHPGWIPLLSDRAGNYIGVDLDPPTQSISTTDSNDNDEAGESHGQSGQVIAFGREIDEKVVLFPGHTQGGWGRFLSSFVDDIERGEFAKLSLDQGSPKGRAAQSEDGDWEDGDGLGDRGYLEGARFGDEEDAMKEGGDGRVWTLRSEWKRWIADNVDKGGLIGAIAERSRRRWKDMGVGVSPARLSNLTTPHTTPRKTHPSLSVTVPPSSSTSITLESGPGSATSTERPTSLRNEERRSPAASAVSLTLSPPSPKSAIIENPLSTTPSPPTSATLVAPSTLSPASRLSKASRRSATVQQDPSDLPIPFSSLNTPPHHTGGRRKRVPPPPPAVFAIDLPTMSDMTLFTQQEDLASLTATHSTKKKTSPTGSSVGYDEPISTASSHPNSPDIGGMNLGDLVRGKSSTSKLGDGHLLPLSNGGSRNNSRTALVVVEEGDDHLVEGENGLGIHQERRSRRISDDEEEEESPSSAHSNSPFSTERLSSDRPY